MTNDADRPTQLAVLDRGLDQLGALLREVPPERLDDPTPCSDWTVRDLVDHAVEGIARFTTMTRGEDVDWAAADPHHDDWAAAYDAHVRDLRQALARADGGGAVAPDMQSAEVAVHSWDLATALGRSTSDLDAEVAERGLAFMQRSLTDELRGDAFGAERPAPPGADAYGRIAAFAGR